jgi:hypothetical protein
MLATMGGDGDEHVDDAQSLAHVIEQFLASSAGTDGSIPAVLEKDNPGYRSRILPVIEALVYPHYWRNCLAGADEFQEAGSIAERALAGPLVKALRRHALALLNDPQRRNRFVDDGIKLSSTSDNSWMSKIALVQFVARQVLRMDETDPCVGDIFASADRAHVRWQTEGAGWWACSDQFVNGVARASRYYPRLITAALWLTETPRTARVEVQVAPAPARVAAPK